MPDHALPTLVRNRSGEQEPFDADRISQSLFAATEELGAANAFLARELTDGVLHFLAAESDTAIPTTAQIAELVEKVVRELGQPELARAYARRIHAQAHVAASSMPSAATQEVDCTLPLDTVRRDCLRGYSLQRVFGRDIASAHEEGLLVLSGLDEPERLDCLVVDGPQTFPGPGWRAAWSQVHGSTARTLVFDGAEAYFQTHGPDWLDALPLALDAQAKTAVLHLNCGAPPPWAVPTAAGPLFATLPQGARIQDVAGQMLSALRGFSGANLHVAWHVSPGAATEPEAAALLQAVLDVGGRCTTTCIFDRPKQAVHLGQGLVRGCPAILLQVELDLLKFSRRPEIHADPERLLAKLPSLGRMAVRAGIQRRQWLRTNVPEVSRGFVLDRARLVVSPAALDEAVAGILGESPQRSPYALALAQRIVQVLAEQLRHDSRTMNLDSVLDVSCTGTAEDRSFSVAAELQRHSGHGVLKAADWTPTLIGAAQHAGVLRLALHRRA